MAALKAQRRTALVPFVTAGDPTPAVTVPLMHAMVEAGADILELGVPFSDPMADGPVIQKASERALAHNVSLLQVMEMVKAFRTTDDTTPVVLMGYLNPVEVLGYEVFADAAASAGVDGVLTVDLPPEEADGFIDVVTARGLDPVFLLAPTSTDERIARIAAVARGYVYYVSLKGVTGAANLDVDSVVRKLEQIRQHTALPVGVGFGISDAQTAARVGAVADAVVVGSVLVRQIEASPDDPERAVAGICSLLAEMRQAMDAGSA